MVAPYILCILLHDEGQNHEMACSGDMEMGHAGG